MLVASKEVIKAYFKANPAIKKFYNMPPAFLNLLWELFNKVLIIGSYIRLIVTDYRHYAETSDWSLEGSKTASALLSYISYMVEMSQRMSHRLRS